MLHRLKPWERSTGPRTEEGKRKASRNAVRVQAIEPAAPALEVQANELKTAEVELLGSIKGAPEFLQSIKSEPETVERDFFGRVMRRKPTFWG